MTDHEAQPAWDGNFTHSEIIRATIGGRSVNPSDRPWTGILATLHEELFSRLFRQTNERAQAREQMIELSPSNVVVGEKSGWRNVARLGCSIQRMDASSTWRHCVIVEEKIRQIDPSFDIAVTVRWKNRPGAAFPGQTRTWRPLRLEDFSFA